jgi:prolyl oligopeptidase
MRSTRLQLSTQLLCLSAWLSTVQAVTLQSQTPSQPTAPNPQPVAPVRPVEESFYGIRVADDYRYMEDLKDPQVQSWFRGQNDYTRAVLHSVPGRKELLKRIVELDESTSSDIGTIRCLPGEVFLYTKLLAGEDTYKIYIRRGLKGAERLLVDPEKISIAEASRKKGKKVINYFAPSNDLRYVAVTIIPGGAEYDTEMHIIETASGLETGDVVLHCCAESNPVWMPDGRSIVYGRWQELAAATSVTETRQKSRVFLHRLGTRCEMDTPVFGYEVVPNIDVDPRKFSMIKMQPNSTYVMGIIGIPIVSASSSFYIASAQEAGKPGTTWTKVTDFSDEVSDVVIHGDDLYLLSFKNAPRYSILRIDARNPDLTQAETILPPGKVVIEEMSSAAEALYVRVLDGGVSRVLQLPYTAKPKPEDIPLPFQGAASVLAADPRVPDVLISLGSWTKAYKIYAYDPSTKRLSKTNLDPDGAHDEFAEVESEEVQVSSYDGTLVPLSIAHPKKMKLDGSNPTTLRAYGAYGVSLGPEFDQTLLAWYEKGGINAVCHVRGGGEYGEEWHRQGKEQTKPNTWLDFIACTRYLIDQKYTSPQHLGALGASAGQFQLAGPSRNGLICLLRRSSITEDWT